MLGPLFVSPASVGVCSAERVSVQQGEPHLPSLAGRGSKVWPYVPESCRRHLLRERTADCHRQAGQRYFISRGSIYSKMMVANLKPPSSSDPGSDSPSSSTPEEADTEDDGQAVSMSFSASCLYFSV